MKNDIFVEVSFSQRQKDGNEICGDVFLSHKIAEENRTIIILSDGLGSGIKANILASMTASMALNFMKANSPIEHTAKIIMNTLPVDSFRKISFSSFTILDIDAQQKVKLIEYGNPPALILKDGKVFEPEKSEINLKTNNKRQKLFTSEFSIDIEDHILLYSDGITQSGMGSSTMPFGWGSKDLSKFSLDVLKNQPKRSAEYLSQDILHRALKNDYSSARDDMTCGIVYLREPRKILFCTGPPYKKENDKYLATQINNFKGQIIVSGGTTTQIVGRELNKEINVMFDKNYTSLPPESEMEGIDLVTEGILTLGKVSEFLESLDQLKTGIPGPAGKIISLLHEKDEIIFLVGTRVNEAHQDPNLPMELEIRRNVVKKIARLLEDKFLKKIEIKYI